MKPWDIELHRWRRVYIPPNLSSFHARLCCRRPLHNAIQKARHLLLGRYVNFVIIFSLFRNKNDRWNIYHMKDDDMKFQYYFFQKFFFVFFVYKISKLKITFDRNTVDACNRYICFSIHWTITFLEKLGIDIVAFVKYNSFYIVLFSCGALKWQYFASEVWWKL